MERRRCIVKTKSSAKNNSAQQVKKLQNKYKFTYGTSGMGTILGLIATVVFFGFFYIAMYLEENYDIALYLTMIPVMLMFTILVNPINRMLIRQGTGILHENHLELYLHKTKHVIEYNKILEIETYLSRRATYFYIKVKGMKTISIYPTPSGKKSSKKKSAYDSRKSIAALQEAIAVKMKEKGLIVERTGEDINKLILARGQK